MTVSMLTGGFNENCLRPTCARAHNLSVQQPQLLPARFESLLTY